MIRYGALVALLTCALTLPPSDSVRVSLRSDSNLFAFSNRSAETNSTGTGNGTSQTMEIVAREGIEIGMSVRGVPCASEYEGKKVLYFRHFTTEVRDSDNVSSVPKTGKVVNRNGTYEDGSGECTKPKFLHLNPEGIESAINAGKCLARLGIDISEQVVFTLNKPRWGLEAELHVEETRSKINEGYEAIVERTIGGEEHVLRIQGVWGLQSPEFMEWLNDDHPPEGHTVIFGMGIGPNLDCPFVYSDCVEAVKYWSEQHNLPRHSTRSELLELAGEGQTGNTPNEQLVKGQDWEQFEEWHAWLNGHAYKFQCLLGSWHLGAITFTNGECSETTNGIRGIRMN